MSFTHYRELGPGPKLPPIQAVPVFGPYGEEPPDLIAKIKTFERSFSGQTKTMCCGLYKYPPTGDRNASLPVSLEIVVGLQSKDDDAEAIARIVHELRGAMAHHIDVVKLPPPLYLKRVVSDYAIAIALRDEQDENDDED